MPQDGQSKFDDDSAEKRKLAIDMPPPKSLGAALKVIEAFKAEQGELVDYIVNADKKPRGKKATLFISVSVCLFVLFFLMLFFYANQHSPKRHPLLSKP